MQMQSPQNNQNEKMKENVSRLDLNETRIKMKGYSSEI